MSPIASTYRRAERGVSEASVERAVAQFLGVPGQAIDPRTPFTVYGIDSLTAMQLVAELEDRFQCSLPESLLTDCPDLRRLTDAVRHACGTREGAPYQDLSRDLMLSDSHLPDDIRPRLRHGFGEASRERFARRRAGQVLLTGATGFLGSALLRALIDAGVLVVCPVRATSVDPAARVRRSLERYGLWRESDGHGFRAIAADLEQPRMGISQELYDELTEATDAVYHAAADVNWVAPYESLRSANVSATTTLLRFACTGHVKRFHFISSLSVCMAADGPRVVAERTDMLPHVDGLPLGYAQSKCVGESLVREAAARGLPAQIYRPALIAGHSASGASNVDDLIAALLKGCVQLGAAPDLDWTFDAVPVDTAANAVVHLSRSCGSELETFHLRHPHPRHWRECVLWMNFFGYPVRLEPYDRWLERLRREARTPDHALYLLRGFFVRRVHGRTAPEHFEQRAHARIECRRTRGRERLAGIEYPPLDAERLDTYLNDLIRRGFLTPPAHVVGRARRSFGARAEGGAWSAQCEAMLRGYFGDNGLQLLDHTLVKRGSEHSIISEMTSWKRGQRTGLFHYRFSLRRTGPALSEPRRGESKGRVESLDVITKVKPSDEDVIEVAERTAAVVDADLHREVSRFRDRLGARAGHLRELEIYRLHNGDPIGRHLPRCYGTWADDDRHEWTVLLEYLEDMALLDAQDASAWTERFRNAAIDGLAAIHARWLGREHELRAMPWIGHVPTTESIVGMTPLWTALARHAAPMFRDWAGARLVDTNAALAAAPHRWAPALQALPRTLIHNDFNPRNVALRNTGDGPCLVAYDWELATVGAPQRDLAEFLCFVLPDGVARPVVIDAIERHRSLLELASGVTLNPRAWQEGFRSALAHFLVSRLSFYAMINRVRPLPFLPRVVRTWSHLYEQTMTIVDRRDARDRRRHA